MAKRKKPSNNQLKDWCERWSKLDHEGKIELCEEYEITYETGRHWFSDSSFDYKPEENKMKYTEDELLDLHMPMKLDFVSFDIETSNLNADFSILLSAVILPFGEAPIVFRADDYPEWKTDRANDRSITKAISDELRQHAIVITHYGLYFDTPFLRAKMLRHRLAPLPQMFAIDSWSIAKKSFKVSSRRLKNLAEYFEVGNKEGVEGALWMEAAYNGSKEALDKIVEHNIIDCRVLEKLAAISFPYLKSIPKL